VRAAVLPKFGDLRFEVHDDVSLAPPGAGEVRLKVRASGLCGSDIKTINGSLGGQVPLLLGHEAAGTVMEVGPGVNHLGVGDHVVVSFVSVCGTCTACCTGHANLCQSRRLPSARAEPLRTFTAERLPLYAQSVGGHAEETVVKATAAVKVPDDVPLDVMALLGCAVTTGVGAALNTAQVSVGSSVIVFGCGGVGINVIQGARIAGATEIVAVDPIASRRDDAVRFGATAAVPPGDVAAVVTDTTGGEGFDYSFESIGRTEALTNAIESTRRGGTTVIVGLGDSQLTIAPARIALEEKRILGSYYGSADVRTEFARLIRLWRRGLLKLEELVTDRITLEEVEDGYKGVRDGLGIRTIVDFDR
jgi:S-(hydroxymethyl)glutathione dehydrogenase/alcohol dehydrogenase